MVSANNLSYQYSGGRPMSYPDFAVPGGEALLIRGKSGSGKTTLLHLLAALLPVQQGDVVIGQTSLKSLSAKATDHFRGQHIGLVLQQHHFVESISAGDNIRLAGYLAGKKPDSAWLEQLGNRLGIQRLLHKLPARLSVGEQQRVSIARALINRPDVLLADEPTSSLDDDNCHGVAALLKQLAVDAGTSLLIVTHDNRLVPDFPNQIVLS